MALVDFAQGDIDIEALVNLVCPHLWSEDYAHGKNVVYLVEGDMLVLHLVPDGIGTLYPGLNLVLYTHGVK